MADEIMAWVMRIADEDLPEDAEPMAVLGAALGRLLSAQAEDRGLDPAAVAAALGEFEWRDACEATGFPSVGRAVA
jgi:hypothetical protein